MAQNIKQSVEELIGNTPLVDLQRLCNSLKLRARIVAKLEYFNPGRSVKDRVGLALIDNAEEQGLITRNTTIIEPTSGNTGVGLALVAAARGYRIILTMPDSMSIERRKLLQAFGAQLVLTPAHEGMIGAIRRANELKDEIGNAYIPGQFDNQANPDIHRRTTAREILRDIDSPIDFFVAGVGTGGTITGVGEVLKKNNPKTKIIAVEPADSPVLSGGKSGPHKLQGIGAGFVPKVLNTNIIDEIIRVKNDEAFHYSRVVAIQEGILAGITSGATIAAAITLARRPENDGKNIVALLPDTGERYLSTSLFNDNN